MGYILNDLAKKKSFRAVGGHECKLKYLRSPVQSSLTCNFVWIFLYVLKANSKQYSSVCLFYVNRNISD